MIKVKRVALILLMSLCVATTALAQVTPHAGTANDLPPGAAERALHAADPANHPILPQRTAWAAVMVIVILLGLFLSAAVIGPVVVALAPEEEPVTHSHDEPPGASHHHGPSGTVNPQDPHDPHSDPPRHGHHGH